MGCTRRVAQSCTLLYRRIAFGKASSCRAVGHWRKLRRFQICETAEYNSALRGGSPFVGYSADLSVNGSRTRALPATSLPQAGCKPAFLRQNENRWSSNLPA